MLKKSLLIYYLEKIFFFLVSGRGRKERCLMLLAEFYDAIKSWNLPYKMALSLAVKWVNMRNVYSNICNMVSAIEMLIIIIAVRGGGHWNSTEPLDLSVIGTNVETTRAASALRYLRFSLFLEWNMPKCQQYLPFQGWIMDEFYFLLYTSLHFPNFLLQTCIIAIIGRKMLFIKPWTSPTQQYPRHNFSTLGWTIFSPPAWISFSLGVTNHSFFHLFI